MLPRFPQFGDFFLFREENGAVTLLWTDTQAGGHAFGLHVLSGGTAQFINLAVLLLQLVPPRMILIDEPELGLHPFAVAVLAADEAGKQKCTAAGIHPVGTVLLNAFSPAEESTVPGF